MGRCVSCGAEDNVAVHFGMLLCPQCRRRAEVSLQ